MAQLLIDTIVFQPAPSNLMEETTADGKTRLVVEGCISKFGVKNDNNRYYSKKIWENVINNPIFQDNLLNRRIVGVIGHPSDGKTPEKEISHVLTNISLKENGEVWGRYEIIPTPTGNILRTLYENNIGIGVSTRGSGSLKKNSMGLDEVQEDYVFDTLDVVLKPSTPGAYPKPIFEDTQTKEYGESPMTAREKYSLLEQKASVVLAVKADKNNPNALKLTENSINDILIEASQLAVEQPELRILSESLVTDLTKKKASIREATMGNADQGFLRTPEYEPAPPLGDGSWPFDPSVAFMSSQAQAMITSLVSAPPVQEAEEEKQCDEDDEDCKKKQKVEEAAWAVIKSKDVPVPVKAFAAAYLTEKSRRLTENKVYAKIVEKMQEKISQAVKDGKFIVEDVNEDLAKKYVFASDLLKEVVRRYHVNNAIHFAEEALEKTGLKDNRNARLLVAETIKINPTKQGVLEAVNSYVEANKASISESTETKVVSTPSEAPKDLPLTEEVKDNTKVAEKVKSVLNEDRLNPKASDFGVLLARRLSKTFSSARSTQK